MSRDEGKRELVFQMTMSAAKEMMGQGIITKVEYKHFEEKMRKKYTPAIGALFARIDLI